MSQLKRFLSYYKPHKGLLILDLSCAFLIALVAVVLIGALTLLSGNITGIFGAAGDALKSAADGTSRASSGSST